MPVDIPDLGSIMDRVTKNISPKLVDRTTLGVRGDAILLHILHLTIPALQESELLREGGEGGEGEG